MIEEKVTANEVDRNCYQDVDDEEEYDDDEYEEDEDEDHFTSVSHELFDCLSNEEVTSTTMSTSSTEATTTTSTTTESTTSTSTASTTTTTTTEPTTRSTKPSTKPSKRKRKNRKKSTTEKSFKSEEETTEATITSTTSTVETSTDSTSSSSTEGMTSTTTTEMSTTTSSTTDTSSTDSTTSTIAESTTLSSTTMSHECTTLSPSLIPLKNCQCYLYCDKKNCTCLSDTTAGMDNEIDKSKNRGGVRRWIDKDGDVYARIYRKIQKLMNSSPAPEPRVRRVSHKKSTSTTTSTTPSSTTTTERKHNDIMQLPGDTRRRRKLPARHWNRLLHTGPNPVELPGGHKNGSFKRDLTHRKSEYREELDCAIRPWSRKCKKWRKLENDASMVPS
uniref:Uncharacterized protein n=1 Tax=Anopheles maculatus TaxID=74869 RepID=A0A182SCJ0_9DIPT